MKPYSLLLAAAIIPFWFPEAGHIKDRDSIYWGWRMSTEEGHQLQMGLHPNGNIVWRNTPSYANEAPKGWLTKRHMPTNSPYNFE